MSSGAQIMVVGDYAIKVGSTEVGDQGRWLEDWTESKCLPLVYASWDNGYVMEKLEEVPNDPAYLVLIAMLLEDQLWTEDQPEVEFVLNDHIGRVLSKARFITDMDFQTQVLGRMGELLHEVAREETFFGLRKVVVHGDPTLDNLMMRNRSGLDDRYVITDPIPARTDVPDLMAVDLGKIMQSAYGYEAVLEGADPNDLDEPREFTAWVHDQHGDAEALAARYFCAFHYMRLLPYVHVDMRPRMEVLLARVLGL